MTGLTMSAHRRAAITIGALYLVTFVTSIPAVPLKAAALAGDTSQSAIMALQVAVLLELVLAIACVGTAVAFFPIGRRANESGALGFVAARVVEAGMIGVGVLTLLAIAGLATGVPAGEPDQRALAALVGVHDAAFLVGPGFIPAVNALCFAVILYRARLVPRVIPLIGLIGAPLLACSAALTIAGVFDQVSPIAAVLALPIAVWEFGIGVWLLVRGFRAEAIERLDDEAKRPLAQAFARG